jgi:glycosyltransferase involved in cell wall biosynthesis
MNAPGSLRSLVVAPATPWGAAAGFRFRMQAVVQGLQRLGDVDVCVVHPERPSELDLDRPDGVRAAHWVRAQPVPAWRWRVLWSPVGPVRVSRLTRAMAERFVEVAAGHDLTWCVEPRGFAPVRSLVGHPVVLDLQNLHDWVARHEQGSTYRVGREPARLATALRKRVVLPRLAAKWERWQRRAAAAVDAVVVCSELDADRLSMPCVVIPNAYPPVEPIRRVGPGAPGNDPSSFTVAFVGTMRYAPNGQAARFFAREVLPRVRAQIPDASFRLVGDGPHLVDDLRSIDGVSVLGYVPDIEEALAGVDALIAPVFFGGGTRVKILEGFARGIPVVATTMAVEGIDADDGVHLLVADDPERFAAALVRLHGDAHLRARLAHAARDRYEEIYSWARAVDAVEQLAVSVVGIGTDATIVGAAGV